MASEHRTSDWSEYRMVFAEPHRELEPLPREAAVVESALLALRQAGVLPDGDYDTARFLAHRQAVATHFEIPWTAISPRLHRLIYAINAIARPANMIAAGVFCGNTFIANAGAAVGAGACYTARHTIGVEIVPDEAARAARNVRAVDPEGKAQILSADAVAVVAEFAEPIHLLYLDATDNTGRGKGLYLDILEACYDQIPVGGLVLAHNSENHGGKLDRYLAFVRDSRHFRNSVNVVVDPEGLEVSVR